MDREQPERLAQSDVAHDLQASVAARRELGPELEDQVLEAFLARVEARVDAHVAQMIRNDRALPPAGNQGNPWAHVVGITIALGLSIPLMAIAGGVAGGFGIVAVVFGLIIVAVLYFVDRWVRFSTRHG